MKIDLLVFDKYFASSKDEIVELIGEYLTKLQLMKPKASLYVTTLEKGDKEVWKGEIGEEKDLVGVRSGALADDSNFGKRYLLAQKPLLDMGLIPNLTAFNWTNNPTQK